MASVSADPSFPHGLAIHVTERRPALVAGDGDRRCRWRPTAPCCPGLESDGQLPQLAGGLAARLRAPRRGAARRGAGHGGRARPASAADRGDHGRRRRTGSWSPCAAGSSCGSAAAATARPSGRRRRRCSPTPQLTALTYVDVRVPERPAVGGTSDPSPAIHAGDARPRRAGHDPPREPNRRALDPNLRPVGIRQLSIRSRGFALARFRAVPDLVR